MCIIFSVIALVIFVLGVLLAFKPAVVKNLSDRLNKSVSVVEDAMLKFHTLSGILLVIVSIIILYFNMRC